MSQAATDSRIAYISNALKMNFAPSAIARGLGITESAVSQLISTYGITAGAVSKKVLDLDDKFDDLEVLAADKLKRALMVCDLDPVRLSMVLSKVNGLRRRSQGEGMGAAAAGNAQLVHLSLPANLNASVNVTLSANNQVIEIEGRTVATVDRSKLNSLKQVDVDNLFTAADNGNSMTADQLAGLSRQSKMAELGVIEHDNSNQQTVQTNHG